MVKELQYISIKRVLDNLLEHPMLTDLTLEQVVRYTLRFIGLFGLPKMYCDKIEDVEIHDFRGLLPCDLISIIQVKDLATGICLRAMTDNFTPGMLPHHEKPEDPPKYIAPTGEVYSKHKRHLYIPPRKPFLPEATFKTQGRVIFTSFPEGKVGIAYKSIPVDEDGFPLLLDNETYLAALEAFIKKQVFTIKFDMGKINGNILGNAQKEYAWAAGQLQDEFTVPSLSEMEALSRTMNTLILNVTSFDRGFVDAGNREYIRRH